MNRKKRVLSLASVVGSLVLACSESAPSSGAPDGAAAVDATASVDASVVDANALSDGKIDPQDSSPVFDAPKDVSSDTLPIPIGIPFGPYNLYGGGEAGPSSWETPLSVGTASFNLSSDYADATGVVLRINSAKKLKLKLLMHMTSGDHSKYITSGKFDLTKWKTAMDTYKTSTITAAVAAAVADGTVVGNSVMDEPHHDSWGGTMTKATIDQMCAYVNGIFPTLPVGVVHGHDDFEPTKSYATCDFIVDQYAYRKTNGDINAYRDAGLALGARDRHAILFSLNILDGSVQDTDGTWDCSSSLTEGKGTYSPNCRMSASQVRDWGIALGSAGCGLTMWRYDATFMGRADNQTAFADVAKALAKVPSKACMRF